ncbi:MAG TPA: MASE1 domain-containing protein [Gaiellaceae bacterium]|jgi:signal transduction histidine kinase|nr:MASE1 domain-containing protein [Gaiellaceae bacterium]
MSSQAPAAAIEPAFARRAQYVRAARYAAGILVLAALYVGAAKLGQALRYTGSVSAVWPPAGLGIGALYLFGLRWWPGIFLGEIVVNAELLLGSASLPALSLAGQQTGNMAEIVVGAIILRRLIGRGAALDRASEVAGMLVALGTATALSATVGTLSMRIGGVIGTHEVARFWRTWWLGDTAGALVVLPLLLAWAKAPLASWRRLYTIEGALLIGAVTALAMLAVLGGAPLTYMVFPALIWAAFRFGPSGATLAVTIIALLTIGITADNLGLFAKQPIDQRALSTQLYILVAALTALFFGAAVSERERAAKQLATAKQNEGSRALEERHRIARDLHDSVSQSLFSALLETRAAQNALVRDDPSRLRHALPEIGELIRSAQSEMRALIFELDRGPDGRGLVAAVSDLARTVSEREHLPIHVRGPTGALDISPRAQVELFAIGREALANVVKHAHATEAWIHITADDGWVSMQVRDDGRGFASTIEPTGHFGLDSMRSRAQEIGAILEFEGGSGRGTVVQVHVPPDGGLPIGT